MRSANGLSQGGAVLTVTHAHVDDIHLILIGPLKTCEEGRKVSHCMFVEYFHHVELHKFSGDDSGVFGAEGAGHVGPVAVFIHGNAGGEADGVEASIDHLFEIFMIHIDARVENGHLDLFETSGIDRFFQLKRHLVFVETVKYGMGVVQLAVKAQIAPGTFIGHGFCVHCRYEAAGTETFAVDRYGLLHDTLVAFGALDPVVSGQFLDLHVWRHTNDHSIDQGHAQDHRDPLTLPFTLEGGFVLGSDPVMKSDDRFATCENLLPFPGGEVVLLSSEDVGRSCEETQ